MRTAQGWRRHEQLTLSRADVAVGWRAPMSRTIGPGIPASGGWPQCAADGISHRTDGRRRNLGRAGPVAAEADRLLSRLFHLRDLDSVRALSAIHRGTRAMPPVRIPPHLRVGIENGFLLGAFSPRAL